MGIAVTILGCHSATPRINAFPTSQYLEINNRHFLIDCGEGTQRQMRKYKVGFSKINHIFIFCSYFPIRHKKPIATSLVLFLLSHTSIFGIIFVISFS